MRVEMSPSVYLALCGLVKDAMEVQSDAAPMLRKAALELAAAAAGIENLPEVEARAAAIADMGTKATASKSAA